MIHLLSVSALSTIDPYLWLIIGAILGVSVIGLFSMAELAVKYEDALLRFFNLIGLTSSNEMEGKVDEESKQVVFNEIREIEQKYQSTYIGDIDWSEYSPQIIASIAEVRYLFQLAVNSETKEITNLRLLNEGMKKAHEFVTKHWFELKDEDRQMFEIVATKLIGIYHKLLKKSLVGAYLFIGYYIIRKKLSYSIAKLLYKLGFKKKLPKPSVIVFSKKFIRTCFQAFQESRTDNLVLRFVNNQTIFVNTIFKLSGRYDLIDESLYFPEALDKVAPVKGDGGSLSWEEQEAISDAYFRRQGALFDALPKEQLLPYKGQYIFFEEGKIKDADYNKIALAKRIYAREGYKDIFLEKVI